MCVNFWTVGNDWIHRRRLVPEKTQYRWAEHSFIFRFWIFDRADSDGVAEYILGESWSTRETSQWRRFLHLNLIFFEELIIQTKTMIRRPSMNHSNSAGASISFNTRSSAYRIRLSSLTRCWTCAKKNLHSHSIRWLTFRPMHSTTTHNDSYTQYYYYFIFFAGCAPVDGTLEAVSFYCVECRLLFTFNYKSNLSMSDLIFNM